MRTLGIDLAAQAKKTAMAEIEWIGDTARVSKLAIGVSDSDIIDAISSVSRAAVDVPFGWPTAFVKTVSAHSGHGLAPDSVDPLDVRWRATDRFVMEKTGLIPLSVSTDKIGAPALRWASLELQIRSELGWTIDRAGNGLLSEVYPAAALRVWGLPSRGYKGARNRSFLLSLAEELHSQAPYLDFEEFLPSLIGSDDAFDSLLCALLARAVEAGLTVHAEPGSPTAASEGWIHLPVEGSLQRLAAT